MNNQLRTMNNYVSTTTSIKKHSRREQ